jgi:predicted Zn-dependent peptidase
MRKFIFRLWSLLLLYMIACPFPALAYDLESHIHKHILNNGMKVLMMERHLSPTVSLYIRYGAGAVDEPSGSSGMAHFLEHLLFKGTKTIGTKNQEQEKIIIDEIKKTGEMLDLEQKQANSAKADKIKELTARLKDLQKRHSEWIIPNEIDRLYTENGAEALNASTGQDLTTYHVSLPANKIELWARIEADRMENPVFREFYVERNVIMEERRQRIEADPDGKLAEQFFATAFQVHPYGRPVLGWPSDMLFLNIDETERFFRNTHAPNNVVIAIVGDIDPEKTLQLINRYFGAIPSRTLHRPSITEEPLQIRERRVEVLFDAKPRLIMGYHKPASPSFDDYVFDVIEAILSKDRTSRFYKSIVEKQGIAERVESVNGLPGLRYPNLFAVFATPRKPHTNAQLEKAIYDEFEILKQEPLSPRELEKIKNQMKADFIRHLNSNASLAGMLSYYEAVTGDFRYLTNYLSIIEKISSQDIMRVAQRYFINENKTLATLSTKPHPAPKAGSSGAMSKP